MKKLILILGFLVLWPPTSSRAELYPPNEAGVTFGGWHMIVRDVEATKKFWLLFGGKPLKIDGIDAIQIPGAFIFLHPGEPSGPSFGAVLDHLAVNCLNCYYLMKRLVEAGVKTDRINPETMRESSWKPGAPGYLQRAWTYVYSPDDMKIEIETNPCYFGSSAPGIEPCPERIVRAVQEYDPAGPIGSDLLHFYVPDISAIRGLYNFYTKFFGATTVQYVDVNLLLPGVKFNIAVSPQGQRPSNRGRVLDSVGFEVKNLEVFSKKLQAAGVKFDQPYSKTRYKSFAHAEFTDPWGTPVQLTEGLNRVGIVTETPKDNVAKGKEVFFIHCAICHSAETNSYQTARRQGGPGLKNLFKMPPHKLRSGPEHKEHTPEMIRKIIVEGSGTGAPVGMNAIGVVLSDQELDNLMAYLQTL